MPRIEIELTSQRPDGTWTWRAAGARQPKGVVDGSLLPAGAKVADVLRAEADIDIEGTRVRSVLPPKGRKEPGPRLEIVGTPRDEPLVTTDERGGKPELKPRRRQDGPARGRGDRPSDRPDGDRPRRDSRPRRPSEPGTARPAAGSGRTRPPARPSTPARPPARRLQAGKVHRQALVASLPPEQRPIAEQLLRGGLAAVRQAVDEQNAKAKASGDPEIKADALVTLAEELLPGVRAAEWRDRAEAAASDPDAISLRDLRTVVTGAGAARDDESRALAARLREALDRRSAAERQEWLDQISASLEEGRVVRALRLSGRPPEPGLRFPAEVAARLAEAASKAMTPTSTADRWLAVLEAVTVSPVRKAVQPEGLPAGADAAFLRTAGAARDKVPAVAALLPETAGAKPHSTPPPRRSRSVPPPPAAEKPAAAAEKPAAAAEKPAAMQERAEDPAPPAAREMVAEPTEPTAVQDLVEEPTAAPASGERLGDHGEDAVGVEELGETVHQG